MLPKTIKVCKSNTLDTEVWENGNEIEVLVQFKLNNLTLARNKEGFILRAEKEKLAKALTDALLEWELEVEP